MGKMVRKPAPELPRVKVLVEGLDGLKCKVGWFESSKYEDGTSVALAAAVNEFGAPSRGIPARPFMRPTIVERQGEWRKLMEGGARQVVKGGMEPAQVMEIIGLQAVGDTKLTISQVTSPPLSKLTLAIRKHIRDGGTVKGGKDVGRVAGAMRPDEDFSGVSTKPLIFTSLMLASLTHLVEK